MSLAFWRSKKRVDDLRRKMDTATNDFDQHRIHAHGLIDAKLEDGEITWEEAIERKNNWDERHGY